MAYKAAIITVGDAASRGGAAAAEMLQSAGFEIIYTSGVPAERDTISAELIKCEYERRADLIVTAGGTGLSHRDVTPEATLDVIEREIPAIPQAMLHYSLGITPRAMLTRGVAGIRGKSLILNLPGNETGARQNMSAVIGVLEHALQMIAKDE